MDDDVEVVPLRYIPFYVSQTPGSVFSLSRKNCKLVPALGTKELFYERMRLEFIEVLPSNNVVCKVISRKTYSISDE